MDVLGIDIGGSGIKGAPVDLKTGALLEERIRIPTPQAPTPEALVETSLEVIGRFGWDGPIGVGFPGVIKGGVVRTAANVAKELACAWSTTLTRPGWRRCAGVPAAGSRALL